MISPNEPHPGRTAGKARVRTLYLSPKLDVTHRSGVLEVRPLFRELIAEACRVGPLVRHDARHDALASLIGVEIEAAKPLPTSIRMPTSDWVCAWTTAFMRNPAELPESGYSRRTLERRLRAETGLTLGQWCQQARALIGLQAIAEGEPVLEAAMTAGFESSSGFIQSFKRQFGTTPGRMLKHGERTSLAAPRGQFDERVRGTATGGPSVPKAQDAMVAGCERLRPHRRAVLESPVQETLGRQSLRQTVDSR
jgi:AraC-like DNA-binding protein